MLNRPSTHEITDTPHLHSYAQASPLIGLAAQLLFAGLPVIQAQTREDRFSA
jgi:hypothetical protein